MEDRMLSRVMCALFAGVATLAVPVAAVAGDPASCKAVRFADVGWTDITATTRSPRILAGPATSRPARCSRCRWPTPVKSKDIDVFLGNWMPTMEADIKPYLDDKSVEDIRVNLEGAKFTLAVPSYTYDEGLKSFQDIAKFKDKLGNKIYGTEAGNDGNRLILDMIANNTFDAGRSSRIDEQGMLAQVARATSRQQPIVFLGWEPHPMNASFPCAISAAATSVWPQHGGARFTNVRAATSPNANAGKLVANPIPCPWRTR
jgi:glycine betaine/proline transport system substrate-binding protein